VCHDKENEGLGVRTGREFNLSLLRKWCWRLRVDQEGLWFKVLVAKYGLEDGRVKGGGGKASWWWRDLCGIREGFGQSVGRWFENNIRRKVGDEKNTYF
jgi:hypothetical protein